MSLLIHFRMETILGDTVENEKDLRLQGHPDHCFIPLRLSPRRPESFLILFSKELYPLYHQEPVSWLGILTLELSLCEDLPEEAPEPEPKCENIPLRRPSWVSASSVQS